MCRPSRPRAAAGTEPESASLRLLSSGNRTTGRTFPQSIYRRASILHTDSRDTNSAVLRRICRWCNRLRPRIPVGTQVRVHRDCCNLLGDRALGFGLGVGVSAADRGCGVVDQILERASPVTDWVYVQPPLISELLDEVLWSVAILTVERHQHTEPGPIIATDYPSLALEFTKTKLPASVGVRAFGAFRSIFHYPDRRPSSRRAQVFPWLAISQRSTIAGCVGYPGGLSAVRRGMNECQPCPSL
jgi:hypothetical protein